MTGSFYFFRPFSFIHVPFTNMEAGFMTYLSASHKGSTQLHPLGAKSYPSGWVKVILSIFICSLW